ncbi:MAG: glycosyltransferase family 2 protein [Methyloprofundus sp.]|nr:glycosyltransferase family 2 protein [Methyloprofundus sp.]
MNSPQPIVDIILLNWNGLEDSMDCLDSLSQSDYKNSRIIVVDNGSTDDSVQSIRMAYPDITLIETGQNLGYAEGNNVGIRYALESNTDYILLLNNDTWVDKNFLDYLVSEAEKTNNAFVYGPAIFYAEPKDTLWFAGAKWNTDKLSFDFPLQNSPKEGLSNLPFESDYICGAALFFHRSIAEKIGLLDAKFFLVWEESDWCFRAKRAGYKSLIVPDSQIWHKIGVSFGSESSPLRLFFSARNRLLWIEKNLSFVLATKTAFQTLRAILPRYGISKEKSIALPKRFIWALSTYFNSWKDMMHNKSRQARLLGVFCYLFRVFGDAPSILRK